MISGKLYIFCEEVYNNIMNSSKTYDPHRLLLNLTDKINLKRSDKYVALSNINIYYIWRKIKKSNAKVN